MRSWNRSRWSDQRDGRAAGLGDQLGCGEAGVPCAQDDDPGCCVAVTTRGDGTLSGLTTTVNGTPTDTTSIVWDPTLAIPQPVWTGDPGTANATRAVYGPDLIRFTCPTGTSCTGPANHDHHGSALETPATADITQDTTYTPWGDGGPTYTPGGADYGYRSELHTGATIHLRARDYDPDTGLFLSPDALDGVDGTTTTNNPYHYTNNDPINRVDPTGLRPIDGGPEVCLATLVAEVSYFARDETAAQADFDRLQSRPTQCNARLQTFDRCVANGGEAWNWDEAPQYSPWACGEWVKDCGAAILPWVCEHQIGLLKTGYVTLGASITAIGVALGNPYVAGCGAGMIGSGLLSDQNVHQNALGGCVAGAGAASPYKSLACGAGFVGASVIGTSDTMTGVLACITGAVGSALGPQIAGVSNVVGGTAWRAQAVEAVVQCVAGGVAAEQANGSTFSSRWAGFIGCLQGAGLSFADAN